MRRSIERKRRFELCLWLSVAALLVGWQLFWPPIIGLADQGDFQKLLGPLGYAPVPKGPEHKYAFLTRTYVRDPSYRQRRFEQITSELILAKCAVFLNGLIGNSKEFDIRLFGLTHAVLILLALARLLYVTRLLRAYRVIWALMLLILTDVGYVAYWNSLYTEPASCIWFLFLLGESVDLCVQGRLTIWSAIRWTVFAVLWITAKTQNAALALPLGVSGIAIAWSARDRKARFAAIAGVLVICSAGDMMYRSLPPAPRVISLYDVIFYGILPESADPQSDLSALGLNPAYGRYSGTLPWSPGTGVADGILVNSLLANVSSFSLFEFYLQRPMRMWRYVDERLPAYLSLRPEFCGNFDRSAGHEPGARSDAIAIWSRFHAHVLARIGPFVLFVLAVSLIAGCLLLILHKQVPRAILLWIALGTCITACCLTAFLVAAFGDAYDNTKHQLLFNLLLDTFLIFGVAAAIQCDRAVWPAIVNWIKKSLTNRHRTIHYSRAVGGPGTSEKTDDSWF